MYQAAFFRLEMVTGMYGVILADDMTLDNEQITSKTILILLVDHWGVAGSVSKPFALLIVVQTLSPELGQRNFEFLADFGDSEHVFDMFSNHVLR